MSWEQWGNLTKYWILGNVKKLLLILLVVPMVLWICWEIFFYLGVNVKISIILKS